MSRHVLDASAVLALINGERGADLVAAALKEGSVIGTVNLAEAVARLRDNGLTEAEIDLGLSSLELEVQSFTPRQAFQAGLMIAETKRAGLSLGDRACLALAKDLGLPVLTGDRSWLGVDVGVQVDLLR